MPTAFISGPLTSPASYFATHYHAFINAAIASSHHFVIGPAPGVDTLALTYLLSQSVPASHITVYLAEFQKASGWRSYSWFTEQGGKLHVEGVTTGNRDAAMTRDSDYDILRYMAEEEAKAFYGAAYWPRVSNTENNEIRRRKGVAAQV